MLGGARWGARGLTSRGLPLGKASLGEYGLGALVWVWLGFVWARYLAPSLPSAAAVAALGEVLGARVGSVLRAGGVLGAAARQVVRGPRLVQVRGCAHGVACPQDVQHGQGAAVEGGGRIFARQPQRVPHRQGVCPSIQYQ